MLHIKIDVSVEEICFTEWIVNQLKFTLQMRMHICLQNLYNDEVNGLPKSVKRKPADWLGLGDLHTTVCDM